MQYRIYLTDASGHRRELAIEHESDAGAVQEARRYKDSYRVEIWQGDRRVGQVE